MIPIPVTWSPFFMPAICPRAPTSDKGRKGSIFALFFLCGPPTPPVVFIAFPGDTLLHLPVVAIPAPRYSCRSWWLSLPSRKLAPPKVVVVRLKSWSGGSAAFAYSFARSRLNFPFLLGDRPRGEPRPGDDRASGEYADPAPRGYAPSEMSFPFMAAACALLGDSVMKVEIFFATLPCFSRHASTLAPSSTQKMTRQAVTKEAGTTGDSPSRWWSPSISAWSNWCQITIARNPIPNMTVAYRSRATVNTQVFRDTHPRKSSIFLQPMKFARKTATMEPQTIASGTMPKAMQTTSPIIAKKPMHSWHHCDRSFFVDICCIFCFMSSCDWTAEKKPRNSSSSMRLLWLSSI
mmetsp:Transcript_20547/g.51868  ORF Transcript_20547/g.51868 Transcript_20547/m.51868 type:complete len:349 (-) Transcript_20547:1473-2519(-)